jgi:hypothetical protein
MHFPRRRFFCHFIFHRVEENAFFTFISRTIYYVLLLCIYGFFHARLKAGLAEKWCQD